VSRLWSRVGVRALSVSLLVVGVAGGVYLGQDRQTQQRTVQADQVVQAQQAEMALLKERQAEHAAARAPERAAEDDAAQKAAVQAKAAAARAKKLELAVIKQKQAKKAAAARAKAASGDTPYTGPIPTSCTSYSGNRAVGCAILLDFGFGLDQMPCLDKLWNRESGWNQHATNAGSGAYGIPQALPGSRMASEGSDWRTSAATQIKWGLKYIKGRYNNPCGAWAHSQNTGWY
jgi:hypothetical protein